MRLLIIDDDVLFLDSWAELLRASGHDVTALPTLHGATPKTLHGSRFDLALVDACLDRHDAENRQGVEVARELNQLGTPSVVVTAYPPTETSHTEIFDLLRNSELEGIISKLATDGDERVSMISFFSLRRRCPNGIAQFKLEQGEPASTLEGQPVWRALLSLLGSKSRKRISFVDVGTLFRALVSPCVTRLTIKEITKGRSGSSLVRGKASFGDGPVEVDVAIKYGNVAAIRSEAMRYDRFCSPLPDGVVAQLRWRVETDKLGAIAYSWVGDSVNEGKPLGSNDVTWEIRRKAIRSLFLTSLNPWFRIFRKEATNLERPQSLVTYYTAKGGLWYDDFSNLNALGLPKAGAELSAPIVVREDKWDFGAYGVLTDPVRCLTEGSGAAITYCRQAPTHGDMHVRNLFVLAEGSPRLIDFGRTALGHVYRDFAALETSLRLTCIDPQSPQTAKEIEDCLCEVQTLGQPLDSRRFAGNYHVTELVETIKEIRRAAADCCGVMDQADAMRQYQLAVLMHVIRYAGGVADEVVDDRTERRKLRSWHAHYAAARISNSLTV